MSSVFDVRPGERRAAGLAFASLLGVTASHTLVETARDALFLAKVPASRLPAVYGAIALLGLVLARVGAARERGGPRRLDPLPASIAGAGLVTGAFWVATATPSRPVLFGLYVYSGLFAAWVAGRI